MLLLPWIPDIQVQKYKTHCTGDYCYYCWRKWAQLTKTSWLLTSDPTLSRIAADTAGVESNPFWPTQTRLTPFPAAILVIICHLNKRNLDRIWLPINSHRQQGYQLNPLTKKKKKKAKQNCAERKSKEEPEDIFQTMKVVLLKKNEREFLQHEVDLSSKTMLSVTEMKMIRVTSPLKTHKIHQ